MYASNFKAQLNQTKKMSKADRAFWRFSSDIMRVAAYGAEGTTTQSVSDNIREGTKRKKEKLKSGECIFHWGGIMNITSWQCCENPSEITFYSEVCP